MAKKVDKKPKKQVKSQAISPKKVNKPAPKIKPKKVEKKKPVTKEVPVKKVEAKKVEVKKEEPKKVEVKPEVKKTVKPAAPTLGKVEKTLRKVVSKKKPESKFEDKRGLDKLYVYFTIVNAGVASNVVSVFEDMGCSVSFVQSGIGTASQEIREALHITDNKKDVVISIIRESRIEDVDREIAAFFLASKRNKGVAFAVKMDAIQGVRLYKFLSQTL